MKASIKSLRLIPSLGDCHGQQMESSFLLQQDVLMESILHLSLIDQIGKMLLVLEVIKDQLLYLESIHFCSKTAKPAKYLTLRVESTKKTLQVTV